MSGVHQSILGVRLAECSKGNYLQIWKLEQTMVITSRCGMGQCVCNQGAWADNLMDAADQLLMF